MAATATPLAFAELLAGAVLLDKGVLAVKGALASGGSSSAGAAAPSGLPGAAAGVSTVQTNLGPTTNPVPGASGGRLDQGFDGTASRFLAPFNGTVVYSSSNDSGWAGGGYVAIASAVDPSKVFYAAEGLLPVVSVGDHVTAGQPIATPETNPYNGILGNYEIGWANPSSPGQPLAQIVSNAASEVTGFYQWILSLGGPHATSTGNAGSP